MDEDTIREFTEAIFELLGDAQTGMTDLEYLQLLKNIEEKLASDRRELLT